MKSSAFMILLIYKYYQKNLLNLSSIFNILSMGFFSMATRNVSHKKDAAEKSCQETEDIF